MNRKTRNVENDTSLSELQYRVMQALWARGEASASDVQQALGEEGRELALTTVATLLSRLARRRLLDSRRDGRQVIYRPLIDERDVRRNMVSELVGRLFEGDARGLLAHLVKESEVDADDLAELRRLLRTENRDD